MAPLTLAFLFALAGVPSFPHPSGPPPREEPEPLLLEPRRLATLPEGLALDFPVQQLGNLTYQRPRTIRWSPNGRSVAYVGHREGKELAVLGDEPLGEFDFCDGPLFSQETSRCLFRVGERTSKKKQKWWLLLDDKEVLEEDWIGRPAISDEADLIAVWTQPGARVDSNGAYNMGMQVLTLLEHTGRSWKTREAKKCPDALSLVQPRIDGDRVLSAARPNDRWNSYGLVTLARGKNKKLDPVQEFAGTPVRFDADGSEKNWGVTLQFVVDLTAGTNRCEAVLNGEPVDREADETYGPYFSSLDKRRAIRVREGDRYGVELVGKERSPEYDYVADPEFGPDDRLAFIAVEGARVAVELGMHRGLGAVEGGQHFVVHRTGNDPDRPEDARWDEIRWLEFSPDGERFAYAARRGDRWQVVLDGVPGPEYDDVGHPRFSEDSKTLAYGARSGRELWWRTFEPN